MGSGCIFYFSLIALWELSGSRSHRLIDRREKLAVVKWLNEEGDGPALHRLVSHQVVFICRNDDDTRLRRNSLKLLLDLKTTYSRHPDINHCDPYGMGFRVGKKPDRAANQLHLQSTGSK